MCCPLKRRSKSRLAPAARCLRGTADQYSKTLKLLREAERPLVYVGAGAARSGAGEEVVKLIERFALPVVSTINGKGVAPDDHPLCVGALPLGDPTCVALFSRADVLLALGTSFSQVNTGSAARVTLMGTGSSDSAAFTRRGWPSMAATGGAAGRRAPARRAHLLRRIGKADAAR